MEFPDVALDTMSLSHPIILGMPWHKEHNHHIDYQKNTLTFDSESCRQCCSHYGKTVPLRSCYRKPQKPLTPTTPQTTDTETTDYGADTMEPPRLTPRTAPKVALIGAAAFAFVYNQPGTELFFMSYKEQGDGTVELANQEVEPDVDMTKIPPEYHDFVDLFNKKEAEKLPPH